MASEEKKLTNAEIKDLLEKLNAALDETFVIERRLHSAEVNLMLSNALWHVMQGLDASRSGIMESIGIITTYGGQADDKVPEDYDVPF